MNHHPFVSVDNMRNVLNKVQYELPRRDSDGSATAAIAQIGGSRGEIPPVKQVVYDLMVDVAGDTDFATVDINTKNEVVVDSTIKYYAEVASALGIRPIARTSATQRGDGDRRQPRDPSDSRGVPAARGATAPHGDRADRAGDHDDGERALVDMRTYVDDPFAPVPSGMRMLEAPDVFTDKVRIGGGNGDDGVYGGDGDGPLGSAGDQNTVVVRRCMSLDGQDRDIATWRSRYSYNTHFDEALKQVQEVSVAAVVVPLQDHTVNAPYLLLAFEELSGLYTYNRNDSIRKSFAKLIPESSYASAHGRTYMVLKPAFDDSVHYNPALPTLSRLTSQLTRPDGMLVSECEDTLRVVKITQSSDGNWILEFDRFWPTKEFGRGDIVRMRDCSTGVDAVDRHINRLAGHEVLEIGRPLADEGCNKIMVRFAGHLDKTTGNFIKDPAAEPVFDGTHAKSEAVGEIAVDCPAMNMSLQMSITVMVKCLEPAAPDTQSM
jgi:hypothetical protein